MGKPKSKPIMTITKRRKRNSTTLKNKKGGKEIKKKYCLVQDSNLGLLLPFCGGGIFSQGVKRHPDFIVVHIGAATGHRTRGLQLFFWTCYHYTNLAFDC